MRAAVENLRITHRFSRANGVVTISIGSAAVIPGRSDAGSVKLLKAADDALYQAKQAGRNRIAAAAVALPD
jgi:diguanylate cyclase (GGDEF)-like protein